MRNWLIRLLGGIPPQEAEFLRLQVLNIGKTLEQILEIKRALEDIRLSSGSQSVDLNARTQPAFKPVPTVSEPWTIKRRRLEAEDMRRARSEKQSTNYEGGGGRNGSSETSFRQSPT